MPAKLSSWVKGIALNAGCSARYKALITSGRLSAEMLLAYRHVSDNTPLIPAGITVAKRELVDVRKMLVDNPEGVMFSGSLPQLCLPERAVSAIDSGRIAYIIESATTPTQLNNLVGSIIVNVDNDAAGFKRANKDAEVDALCLLMYWHREKEDHTSAFQSIASDLTFHGRRLGTGSKHFAARLELINAEEKSRETLGVSAWRKCIFLTEYSTGVEAEGRFSEVKGAGEKLMKAMAEDCAKIEGWNLDTLGRYLQIGRRLSEESVNRWLILWEAVHKRNAFLDGIMMLRACVGVTPDDDELALLLQIIFLEQRSGVTKTHED